MSKLENVHAHTSVNHPTNRKKNTKLHSSQVPTLSLGEEAKLVFQEISSIPTKTPVSVLQELLCRRGSTPKYELVQIEGAIHEPIFRYRVFLNSEYLATGTGRSKKDAKHAAAKNLLELLVGKITLEQANAVNGVPPTPAEMSNPPSSPYDDKVMGNPIGWLQEMCMSRRWPPPSYDMEHEEGLPHERQFTIACNVLKNKEIGTGKSKKLAKRVAAHKMWQVLQDMPQEGVDATYDEDDARFATLKDSKIQTLNNQNSHKVSQFHKNLKQNTGPKLNLLQKTPLNQKDFNYVQFLQEISAEQQFEVTFVDIDEKALSGKLQCLVQLSTLPVAVCYGYGTTSKEAQAMAARNALEYLKIMTKK